MLSQQQEKELRHRDPHCHGDSALKGGAWARHDGNFLKFTFIFIYLLVVGDTHAVCKCVKARGQFVGVDFLFLPCGFQRSNIRLGGSHLLALVKPIIPASREAEVGGLREFRTLSQNGRTGG